MILFGFDTSGKTASVALLDTDTEIFLAQTSLYTTKTHSQVIMPEIKYLLEQSGKSLGDVGLVAVANGPGSYTGLRIGVSVAKAMAYALGIDCAGVSTLKGLAYSNIAKGVICSVMTARAELVYAGVYESDGYEIKPICDERLMSRDELAEILAVNGKPLTLCGDGSADFFRDYRSPMFTIAPPQNRLQNACGICLGALNQNPVSPDELEVSYLQKVKAEKDLENK
ncbi:MAG: tRNA (adenosine(37)-N6)-threonylcarbamoyltransferase complex dimerization subunit type 1 TsaB [Ruminococcus flavefaciens]|nr:tRNA (adenosine(37)-N6)-threonylcarbamoyltransferase complex dimerization subunit type 1 TsaB [Ruminococcus flavefaciens]MCM1229236.1 tRNA (adenosine(37)-N6)-threonylcarbamoyltransferase complex dimerization subunit type 1 TsaB [Ruminococcus flavefaciens]